VGIVAALSLPAMGLALLGTAVAVWTSIVAGVGALIGGITGNAYGANKTNRALVKEKAGSKTLD
jgi:hypothetical protein